MHPSQRMAIIGPAFGLHKTGQITVGGSLKEAEWYLGCLNVVHGMFRHHHDRCKFLKMFKTLAQRMPTRLVVQRRQKGGTIAD